MEIHIKDNYQIYINNKLYAKDHLLLISDLIYIHFIYSTFLIHTVKKLFIIYLTIFICIYILYYILYILISILLDTTLLNYCLKFLSANPTVFIYIEIVKYMLQVFLVVQI